jgi:flavoprotein
LAGILPPAGAVIQVFTRPAVFCAQCLKQRGPVTGARRGDHMKVFRLYGTSACHLCETAAEMLAAQLATARMVEVEQVDICQSDRLFDRYGLRIPVLQHPDKRELDWPFTLSELQAFLSS